MKSYQTETLCLEAWCHLYCKNLTQLKSKYLKIIRIPLVLNKARKQTIEIWLSILNVAKKMNVLIANCRGQEKNRCSVLCCWHTVLVKLWLSHIKTNRKMLKCWAETALIDQHNVFHMFGKTHTLFTVARFIWCCILFRPDYRCDILTLLLWPQSSCGCNTKAEVIFCSNLLRCLKGELHFSTHCYIILYIFFLIVIFIVFIFHKTCHI